MPFVRMVSMERTPEEKAEAFARNQFPTPIRDMPDVPPGLCICLTEVELEKLNLDDDCEVGDMIHISGMARVTSISKNETDAGCNCRVELSITDLAVEDEDLEATPEGLD
jgi:hypothetical protein